MSFRKHLGILATSCLLVSQSVVHGLTYYVSPGGDDSASGTSPATPWKTVAKVNTISSFAAGDKILFQQSGVWRETLTPAKGGSSTAALTFGAYGEGALPLLSGANIITGWTPHSTGTPGTYKAPLASNTYMVTSSNRYLTRGSSADALNVGQFFWVDATDTLFINDGACDPAVSGRIIEAARRDSAISCGLDSDYIVIENLRLEKTNDAVLLTGGQADYWTVRNCEVFFGGGRINAGAGLHLDGNAHCQILDNRISYVQGDGIFFYRAPGGQFIRNHIDQVRDTGGNIGGDTIQLLGSPSAGAPLVDFVIKDNIVIRESSNANKGNIIVENGSRGLISGNKVYSGRFGIAIYVNDTIIEKNYIENAGTNDALRMYENRNQTDITIRYNVVNGCATSALGLGRPEAPTPFRNIRIYNNIFTGSVYGVGAAVPVSGEFKNNIVASGNISFPAPPAGGTMVSDYNVLRDNGTLAVWNGVSYPDLASFQTATGQDLNSTSTPPKWVGAGDFRVLPGSSSIDRGASLGLTEDIYNSPVPTGLGPDIGAAEYTGTLLQAPAITSGLTAAGTVGVAFYYYTAATNGPTYSATGLPPGVSITAATGVVGGRPTSAGTYNTVITATNAAGSSSVTVKIRIVPATTGIPVVNSTLTAAATEGSQFTYQITATNSPFSFNATWLPEGLSVDRWSGLITGVPLESGEFGFPITATNNTGVSTTARLVLNIAPPPSGSWSSWLNSAAFTPAEVLAGLDQPSADAAGDGIPNLVKFALGHSNPRTPLPAALYPKAVVNVNGALAFSFPRAEAGVKYEVEASSELSAWSVIAVDPGIVGETVTATDTLPPGQPRRFMRLRLSLR